VDGSVGAWNCDRRQASVELSGPSGGVRAAMDCAGTNAADGVALGPLIGGAPGCRCSGRDRVG
jgi:hypothetical protein